MPHHIPMTNRAGRAIYTLVDAQDYAWVSEYRWRLNSKGYAIRSYSVDGREIVLCLHREIMQPDPGLVVDHIDHDRLNNQRVNLRILTPQQNLMNRRLAVNNTSGYKGVIWKHNRWHARIQYNERDIHLGHYDEVLEAALVYDAAAIALFGEDIVCRNLPGEQIPPEIAALVAGYLAR